MLSLNLEAVSFPSRRFPRPVAASAWQLCALVCACSQPAHAQQGVRLIAIDRVQLGLAAVTLAGVVPEPRCDADVRKSLANALVGRQGHLVSLPQLPTDAGFVVLDTGESVNELALATGCAGLDLAGLSTENTLVSAMERAWRRAESQRTAALSAPAGAASASAPVATTPAPPAPRPDVTKWTGSAGITTQPFDVPSGEFQIVTLAIPSGAPPGELAVLIYGADPATPLQTIGSGPVQAKRMARTPVSVAPGTRVRLVIEGTGVLWGVWAETR